MDAIALAEAVTATPLAPPNPFLRGRTPAEHIRFVLSDIAADEVERALTLLPFHSALMLITQLTHIIDTHINAERAIRALITLVSLHSAQLLASSSSTRVAVITDAQRAIRRRLSRMRRVNGENIAAMKAALNITATSPPLPPSAPL